MSDEAHFHSTGEVYKQNLRYCARDNPRIIHHKPLHSARVTVWRAVASFEIISLYIYKLITRQSN